MNQPKHVKVIQRILASVAVLFGIATLVAGSGVIAGADPGYLVFRPLLFYNTTMGVAYVATGVMAWKNLTPAKSAAAAIFMLNLLVLGAVGYLYTLENVVAIDSVRAMILRTVVWLILFLGLTWTSRRQEPAEPLA